MLTRSFTSLAVLTVVLTPLAASARPVTAPKPHVVAPHDHTPKVRARPVSAHK